MEYKKIAIVGSRTYSERLDIFCQKFFDEISRSSNIMIVSGGAKGADSMAELLAENYQLPFVKFPAQWDVHGKSAGFKRNAQIAEFSDMCVAFWDMKSKGTANTISLFQKLNKVVRIVDITRKDNN